jgi:hypothetical protein
MFSVCPEAVFLHWLFKCTASLLQFEPFKRGEYVTGSCRKLPVRPCLVLARWISILDCLCSRLLPAEMNIVGPIIVYHYVTSGSICDAANSGSQGVLDCQQAAFLNFRGHFLSYVLVCGRVDCG